MKGRRLSNYTSVIRGKIIMQVSYSNNSITDKILPSQKKEVKSGEIHVIKERCKECHLCIDFCPMQVLVESGEVNDKGYHIPKLEEEPDKGEWCVASSINMKTYKKR
jgi:ferredoxin